jgi:hypothetical protein
VLVDDRLPGRLGPRGDGRDRGAIDKRAAHGALHRAEDGVAVSKTHFGLGRVHVHVDVFRRQIDAHDAQRIAAHHQECVIGLCDRRAQSAVLYPPTVHEDRQVAPIRPRQRRRTDESTQLYSVLPLSHRERG